LTDPGSSVKALFDENELKENFERRI